MAAGAAIAAGAGLALQGYNLYDAYQRRKAAQSQLDRLSKEPLPEYGVAPQIADYYRTGVDMAASPRGFSAAERGNFRTGISRSLAAQRAAARNMFGGNSARALGALDILPRISAETQLAASDAQLARQQQNQAFGRMYQGASAYQNARNMNTQAALQRRLMTEQALGGAIRSQNDYMRNTLGSMGNDLIGAGAMSYLYGNQGVGGEELSYRPVRFAGARNSVYDAFNPDERQFSVDPSGYGYENPRTSLMSSYRGMTRNRRTQ